MEQKNYEAVDLVMKQRDEITAALRENTKTLNGFVAAFIAAFTAGVSFIVSSEIPLHHFVIFIFIFIQILFAVFFYVFSIISLCNTCRDMIRAIDDYLREYHDIKKLFNNGEMAYRHVSRYGDGFTLITFGIAIVIISFVAAFVYQNYAYITGLIRQFPIYSFIVFAEAAIVLVIIISQMYYNLTGKSKYYGELYCFLCTESYPVRKLPIYKRIIRKSSTSNKKFTG